MMLLVAIGANLPGPDGTAPLDTCRTAVALLAKDMTLAGLSPWYLTEPVPPSGQPPYVNAVAHLDIAPDADPAAILATLMRIEAQCGRVRGVPNAARTLDLDLIAMGTLVRQSPDPILPHPRAHERAFVLAPLADVAPGWVHPVLGQTVEALLRGVSSAGIRLM